MKKSILLLAAISSFTFSSLAQSVGETTYKMMSECKCKDIIMISNKIEKPYTALWLEGITFENGFITFSKGETIHSWNADKIVFVEKGNGSIRVYLE